MTEQRDFCAHGVHGDPDDHMRFIEVGGVRFEERILPGLGDCAIVEVTARARGAGVGGAVTATELAYLARQLCGWFTDPEVDVKQADFRVTRVIEELDRWNARAKEDEEHPPYEELTSHLRAALDSLDRLRAIFGTEIVRDHHGLTTNRR